MGTTYRTFRSRLFFFGRALTVVVIRFGFGSLSSHEDLAAVKKFFGTVGE